MAWALCPLRQNDGSRVLIDPTEVVALKENAPGDAPWGQAAVQLSSGAYWYLLETVDTIFFRLKAASLDADPWAIYGPGFKGS